MPLLRPAADVTAGLPALLEVAMLLRKQAGPGQVHLIAPHRPQTPAALQPQVRQERCQVDVLHGGAWATSLL